MPVETSEVGNVVWCNILATSLVMTRRCLKPADREIPVGRLGTLRSDRPCLESIAARCTQDRAEHRLENRSEGAARELVAFQIGQQDDRPERATERLPLAEVGSHSVM